MKVVEDLNKKLSTRWNCECFNCSYRSEWPNPHQWTYRGIVVCVVDHPAFTDDLWACTFRVLDRLYHSHQRDVTALRRTTREKRNPRLKKKFNFINKHSLSKIINLQFALNYNVWLRLSYQNSWCFRLRYFKCSHNYSIYPQLKRRKYSPVNVLRRNCFIQGASL